MKTIQVLIIAALLAALVAKATDDNDHITTNYTNPELLDYRPRPDVIWGQATNGIKCGVSLRSWPSIYYFFEASLTNAAFPDLSLAKTNTAIPKNGFHEGVVLPWNPLWMGSTNGCLGMMELLDVNSHTMRLKKPEANNPKCYPEYLRWTIIQPQIGGLGNPNGPKFAWHGFQKYRNLQHMSGVGFELEDLFEITEPGEYRLTLWPKIYKRSEKSDEDQDLYHRIDIPPVTVTIRWP